VTVDYLKELAQKKDLFLASAKDPQVQGTELAEGFTQIAEYASSLKGADLEKTRVDLAVEYAGLILGMWRKPNLLRHPSESAYREGQLMGERRDQVLAIYRRWGVDKTREFKEPEDHIALELQFMTQLSEKTSAALKNGDLSEVKKCLEAQRDFLDEHLGIWVPKLCADILKLARSDFYKAIVKITQGYLNLDKQMIAELIGNLPSESDLKQ
jgi:TorA maturation chaperone TorD